MADRPPLAPICRVITELHIHHPITQSEEPLPTSYNLEADGKADAHKLIENAVRARLVARSHARVLKRVVRTWTQQPAIVRKLTIAVLDLFRVIEGDTTAP